MLKLIGGFGRFLIMLIMVVEVMFIMVWFVVLKFMVLYYGIFVSVKVLVVVLNFLGVEMVFSYSILVLFFLRFLVCLWNILIVFVWFRLFIGCMMLLVGLIELVIIIVWFEVFVILWLILVDLWDSLCVWWFVLCSFSCEVLLLKELVRKILDFVFMVSE